MFQSVQLQLDDLAGPVPADLNDGIDYGEVFTRRWVVELILDLVGYTADRDLGSLVIIEPSCGTGAFLIPVVDRLLASCERRGRELTSLFGALRAFDLLDVNAELARKAVAQRLQDAGMALDSASELVDEWVSTGDFLLQDHPSRDADFVVGNPPYIRLENVAGATMARYRQICGTMRGRSDIYVGFIERGLELLKQGGALGFICADRWMRNQYGSKLRELVSRSYAIDAVIAMHEVNAFENEVSAYPAVVVLRNGPPKESVVAETRSGFGSSEAKELEGWMRGSGNRTISVGAFEASKVDVWPQGGDLWPAGSPARMAVLADLETRFPPLEDPFTKTRVGIGVATGCDEVYLTTRDDLVEEERLIPILQASDISSGSAAWSGTYLVNPWDRQGLVDLKRFPLMERYLQANKERLSTRHVARRRPQQWYRTIDRVDPELQRRPKLVLPDLKAASHPVLDDGSTYPHHNLYFVVSEGWDLEVLGGLLLSDVTNLFVGSYCVKMRGGCYRFQAQYLRRVRVPHPQSVSKREQRLLASAFAARDVQAATAAALSLYGLKEYRSVIQNQGCS